MINILSACDDIAFGSIIQVVKNLLNLIQIIGPLLCMISLVMLFINYAQNPEDKKVPAKIKNSILALIILFFIPLIVNVVMNMVDESNSIARCWKSNVKVSNSSSYIEIEEENKKQVIGSNTYEKGTPKPSSNNSNNNSTTSSSNQSSSNVSIPANALNKQQAESLFNTMQVPQTSEIEELAYKNYGMSKQNVERMIALAANEGYFKEPYFAYLCDSTIVNIYLHHKSDIDSGKKNLIHVWGGADTSYDDHIVTKSKSFDFARMDGAKKTYILQ